MKFRNEWSFTIRNFEELEMSDYQVSELIRVYSASGGHAKGFTDLAQRIVRYAGVFDQVVGIREHSKTQKKLQNRETSQGFRRRACQRTTVVRALSKNVFRAYFDCCGQVNCSQKL